MELTEKNLKLLTLSKLINLSKEYSITCIGMKAAQLFREKVKAK